MFSALLLLTLGTHFHDVASYPTEDRLLSPDVSDGKEENLVKILNGEEAKPGEFPYVVSLEAVGQHFCGGTVVSKYWVVSAAHCFPMPKMSSMVHIRAGTTKKGSGGSVHQVEEIICHPKFNEPSLFNNDIAMLKVKEPFVLGGDVEAAPWTKHGQSLRHGSEVISAGWGILSNGGEMVASPSLMKITLKSIGYKKCSKLPGIKRLLTQFKELQVTDHMICARDFGKDTTQGDSGGPLLHQEGGKMVLVGVVSWGEGDGRWDSPGVYTDVSQYDQWISYIMKSNN